jgi:hypothetical protein
MLLLLLLLLCGLWLMAYSFVVYDLRFLVCSLWLMASRLWFMVYGLWFVLCGLRFGVCGLRFTVWGLQPPWRGRAAAKSRRWAPIFRAGEGVGDWGVMAWGLGLGVVT